MGKLQGKIAVITGANSGIGLATAHHFVDEGAYIYIIARRQKELEAAAARIGKNVTAVPGDVSHSADLDRLYAAVKQQHGRLDVVFANAGGSESIPLGAINEAHFDKMFNINVKGLVFTVQKALPFLKDGSSIILNASTAASTGNAELSIYSAAKAAVRALARSWTLDLKDRRIRVNALSPGPVETPGLGDPAWTTEEKMKFKARLAGLVPLGRLGHPDEVAKAVVFLASDDSSFVNGIELFVDGGMAQI